MAKIGSIEYEIKIDDEILEVIKAKFKEIDKRLEKIEEGKQENNLR